MPFVKLISRTNAARLLVAPGLELNGCPTSLLLSLSEHYRKAISFIFHSGLSGTLVFGGTLFGTLGRRHTNRAQTPFVLLLHKTYIWFGGKHTRDY